MKLEARHNHLMFSNCFAFKIVTKRTNAEAGQTALRGFVWQYHLPPPLSSTVLMLLLLLCYLTDNVCLNEQKLIKDGADSGKGEALVNQKCLDREHNSHIDLFFSPQ